MPGHLQKPGLSGLEPETMSVLLAIMETVPGGAVFDVGANVGPFSLVGPAVFDRDFVAFEPTPDVADALRRIGNEWSSLHGGGGRGRRQRRSRLLFTSPICSRSLQLVGGRVPRCRRDHRGAARDSRYLCAAHRALAVAPQDRHRDDRGGGAPWGISRPRTSTVDLFARCSPISRSQDSNPFSHRADTASTGSSTMCRFRPSKSWRATMASTTGSSPPRYRRQH